MIILKEKKIKEATMKAVSVQNFLENLKRLIADGRAYFSYYGISKTGWYHNIVHGNFVINNAADYSIFIKNGKDQIEIVFNNVHEIIIFRDAISITYKDKTIIMLGFKLRDVADYFV